ncbi:MAG: hypothetical protein HY072_02425 [Deltaproteobacteria bacterium]|nr:hypothetical protein [Deltaproteobacteria bacterium]
MQKTGGDLLSLERVGQFELLVKQVSESPETLDSRSLAAYARACVFTGRTVQAQNAIKKLQQCKLEQPESKIVLLLSEAALARFTQNWKLAQEKAESALRLAHKIKADELAADAEFAIGISLVENGRLFLGLDLFEKLSKDTTATEYRRGLAASNLAWILWDLGRVDLLYEIYPLAPLAFQPRLKLALSIVKSDITQIRHLVQNPLPELPPQQVFFIALFLVEAFTVLGNKSDLTVLKTSWVFSYLINLLSSGDLNQILLAERCLALMGQPMKWTTIPQYTSWRTLLDATFLEALYFAKKSPDRAKEIWCSLINPVCRKYFINTPLIPVFENERFYPETSWSTSLAQYLKLEFIKTELLDERFILKQDVLIYKKTNQELKLFLKQSPIAIRFLQVLSTHFETPLKKKDLHVQLTRSAYSSVIHDGRILKLLNRLEKKLELAGFPKLWYLPRDNSIVCTRKIEVQS